jgi:hypothetical protein
MTAMSESINNNGQFTEAFAPLILQQWWEDFL